MITADIVACDPHRAFHGLLLVSGLRRRPLSSRFSIRSESAGKSRFIGPLGWEDAFTECREICAGWDVQRNLLWLLLGPDVTLLLDRKPFTFTLLQTGESIGQLTMPEQVLRPGDTAGLPPLPESAEKGVAALLPPPSHAGVPVRDRVARQGSTLGGVPPIRPFVLGIALVLGAVMAGAYYLNNPGNPRSAPAVVEATTTAPAPSATSKPCGRVANPAALKVLPLGVASVDAMCVARVWFAAGRVDETRTTLTSLAAGGYIPAMLELAKILDPLSGNANPPADADAAKDGYRKVIQQSGDEATRTDARDRLDALMRH